MSICAGRVPMVNVHGIPSIFGTNYRRVAIARTVVALQRKTNGVFSRLDTVLKQQQGTWIAWREHDGTSPFTTFPPADVFGVLLADGTSTQPAEPRNHSLLLSSV
jgi:hypothetical protein